MALPCATSGRLFNLVVSQFLPQITPCVRLRKLDFVKLEQKVISSLLKTLLTRGLRLNWMSISIAAQQSTTSVPTDGHYTSDHEYRIDGTSVFCRLIEDRHSGPGVPEYQDMRDGVVLELSLIHI